MFPSINVKVDDDNCKKLMIIVTMKIMIETIATTNMTRMKIIIMIIMIAR